MYCDRCGARLSGNEIFCAACGKQVNPLRPAPGRVESHLRPVAVFWIAYSALRLLGGWFLTAFFSHWGAFWNPSVPFFIPGILRGVGMISMAGGVLGLITGWGLLNREPWARILAIVLGFVVVFHIGIGTVLGIYTLWVLLPAQSAREYEQRVGTV